MILILARPQQEQLGEAQREMKNIHLLLDSSSSMTIKFGGPKKTRHDAAMDAVEAFLDRRKQDSYALTLFGGDVLFWIPLTTDLQTLRLCRPFIYPDTLPRSMSGTLAGKALAAVGRQMSQTKSGDRVLIMISDGASSDLQDRESVENIKQLYIDARIVLFTVLVSDQPVSATVQAICQATGGDAVRATDIGALSEVFDHIDRMTTAKLRPVSRSRVDHPRPILFCLAVLAGLHTTALFGLRFMPW